MGACAALALSGCATGQAGSKEQPSTQFGSGQKLSGTVQVMGFGGDDEVGKTRLALARAAIAPATLKQAPGAFEVSSAEAVMKAL